jgi:hypothetical protein
MELPIARYRFTAVMRSALTLPDYAGSLLRGVFGHALRFIGCQTGMSVCTGCPSIQGCPYAEVFEPTLLGPAALAGARGTQSRAAPYIIEPPTQGPRTLLSGDELHFHMVLIGPGLRHLLLVLTAWQRALRQGLGPSSATGTLVRVDRVDGEGRIEPIWSAEEPWIKPHSPLTHAACYAGDTCTLEFITPLRIQRKGIALGPDALDAEALVSAITRRLRWLDSLYFGQRLPPLEPSVIQGWADTLDIEMTLAWRDLERFSRRQQQHTPLGGVVGEARLRHVPAPLMHMLSLGQSVHIGKETVFGLGQYIVKASASPA